MDTSNNVEDIRSFVSSMDINVISCFEVKPRRRRNVDAVPDRKAFRLCICADDTERLLVADNWSDSIMISEWYFKPQTSRESPDDKRLRVDERHDGSTLPGDIRPLPAHHGSSMDLVENDNDVTIPLDRTLINAFSDDVAAK